MDSARTSRGARTCGRSSRTCSSSACATCRRSSARRCRAARGGIGTPDDLRTHLRKFETAGVDQVTFIQQAGMNKHEHICEALELFAAEVMPEFKARAAERERAKQRELAPFIEAALARKVKMPALARRRHSGVPGAGSAHRRRSERTSRRSTRNPPRADCRTRRLVGVPFVRSSAVAAISASRCSCCCSQSASAALRSRTRSVRCAITVCRLLGRHRFVRRRIGERRFERLQVVAHRLDARLETLYRRCAASASDDDARPTPGGARAGSVRRPTRPAPLVGGCARHTVRGRRDTDRRGRRRPARTRRRSGPSRSRSCDTITIAPFVLLQRHGQRVAHLDVEVVGRLVEQQQGRLLPRDQRKHRVAPSRRPIAIGSAASPCRRRSPSRRDSHVRRLIRRFRVCAAGCVPSALRSPLQQIQLMLRKVADGAVLAAKQTRLDSSARSPASVRINVVLPGAVGAEHADSRAGRDRSDSISRHRFAVVAERCVLELNQHRRHLRRIRKAELDTASRRVPARRAAVSPALSVGSAPAAPYVALARKRSTKRMISSALRA